MNAVVLISAIGEWNAVKDLLEPASLDPTPFGESFTAQLDGRSLLFVQGGWGKVAAAAGAQYVIDHFHPDLLVNLGTCGGFLGRIEQGTHVLVDKTIIYDIIEQMTDPDEAIERYSTVLDLGWLPRVTPSPVLRGLMLSADRDILREDIPALVKKYDGVAADWESGAIAWVASRNKQKLLILRGVSDLVSQDGDDVYGEYAVFENRAKDILRRLIEVLPKWLTGIEKVQQGYRV